MSQKFNKTTINFWLDTFLLVVFMLLCWISIVLRYAFPSPLASEGWTLWGGSYLDWSDYQFFTLCVLMASIVLHVMLHWSWVCGVIAKWYRHRFPDSSLGNEDNGSRTLWGVGLLIAVCNIVGLGIAAAVLSIQSPPS